MYCIGGPGVCVREGMRRLLASVNGDSCRDIAAKFFSYDALRSNKNCARFEVLETNNAKRLEFYEAFVCLFLQTFANFVIVEYCEGFAYGKFVRLAWWWTWALIVARLLRFVGGGFLRRKDRSRAAASLKFCCFRIWWPERFAT